MRRTLKFLHEVGSAGLMGAVAAQAILSFAADGRGPLEYAAMRHAILLVSQWLLVPSLLVVLVSGLAAIAAHHPFQNAGWAWMKPPPPCWCSRARWSPCRAPHRGPRWSRPGSPPVNRPTPRSSPTSSVTSAAASR
ncbi:MAG: DUF2269 family protein [Deltaproteobacteria bacterium]|nr:DUF2269 family protein [Deltaproteobacteria bacterium]MBK8716424.1 DUF2269 family protein [Deltaproteobacteria bacterium]MBP7287856.1 DUF2269 family protein [Nannocystaceae bacterium]